MGRGPQGWGGAPKDGEGPPRIRKGPTDEEGARGPQGWGRAPMEGASGGGPPNEPAPRAPKSLATPLCVRVCVFQRVRFRSFVLRFFRLMAMLT